MKADGSTDTNRYLNLNGSTAMTGGLNMNNNNMINLATPTLPTDGVNKNYVDTSFTALGDSKLNRDGTTITY